MRVTPLFALLAAGLAAVAVARPPADEQATARDWYFGEALYYAQQGHYFEALERLDAELGQHRAIDEPALDSLYRSLHEAEFSVGDFELNYRMHLRPVHTACMSFSLSVRPGRTSCSSTTTPWQVWKSRCDGTTT